MERRKVWLKIAGISEFVERMDLRVCEIHFKPEHFCTSVKAIADSFAEIGTYTGRKGNCIMILFSFNWHSSTNATDNSCQVCTESGQEDVFSGKIIEVQLLDIATYRARYRVTGFDYKYEDEPLCK